MNVWRNAGKRRPGLVVLCEAAMVSPVRTGATLMCGFPPFLWTAWNQGRLFSENFPFKAFQRVSKRFKAFQRFFEKAFFYFMTPQAKTGSRKSMQAKKDNARCHFTPHERFIGPRVAALLCQKASSGSRHPSVSVSTSPATAGFVVQKTCKKHGPQTECRPPQTEIFMNSITCNRSTNHSLALGA